MARLPFPRHFLGKLSSSSSSLLHDHPHATDPRKTTSRKTFGDADREKTLKDLSMYS